MSEPRRGAPVKGMILGVVVDIGGSLLASFVLFFIWAIWLGATGHDAEAITQEMSKPDPLSQPSLVGYAVGTGFSWLGGYVCAVVAQETEMQCAAVVAAISTLVGLAMGAGLPLGLYLTLTALTFATVMLGAWMGQQRNARQA
jgi:hypothetical protein